jgi:hypothetical protein
LLVLRARSVPAREPARVVLDLLPHRLDRLAASAVERGIRRGPAQLAFNKLLNRGYITLRGTPEGVFVVGRRRP